MQFTDLTVEESVLVYNKLADRFGQDQDQIESFVFGAYDVASKTYALVDYNIRAVQSIRFKAQRLLGAA